MVQTKSGQKGIPKIGRRMEQQKFVDPYLLLRALLNVFAAYSRWNVPGLSGRFAS